MPEQIRWRSVSVIAMLGDILFTDEPEEEDDERGRILQEKN